MKSIYTLALFLITVAAFSQAPKYINYQGVARYTNGKPITKPMTVMFKIMALGQPTTAPVFSETQNNITPNALGIFNTQIGNASTGGVTGVLWGSGSYSLQVTIDTTSNNSGPMVLGMQRIVSTPYALHADSADNVFVSYGNGGALTIGKKTVQLPSSGIVQNLSINGNVLSISGGTPVTIPTATFVNVVSPTASSVSVTGSANAYTVNGPPTITVSAFDLLGPTASGLAQVIKNGSTYSVMVAPSIGYSQATGSLTITENAPLMSYLTQTLGLSVSPLTYNFGYNITPAPNLTPDGQFLYLGPTTNTVNMLPITPWRTQPSSATTVTLANNSWSVGIGTNGAPVAGIVQTSAKLHVDGYTKLGATAPAVGMMTISATTAASPGASTIILLPTISVMNGAPTQITGARVLSVAMLAQTAGPVFTPPGFTGVNDFEYTYQISGNNIIVYNKSGNSANISTAPLKIIITYTP